LNLNGVEDYKIKKIKTMENISVIKKFEIQELIYIPTLDEINLRMLKGSVILTIDNGTYINIKEKNMDTGDLDSVINYKNNWLKTELSTEFIILNEKIFKEVDV